MSSQAFEPRMSRKISTEDFNSWSKKNFYRTSYTNHYTDLPEPPKNVAIPGYAGFVPFMKSNNLYGKSYSPLTRTAYSNPNLGVNKFHLSSTGFNFQPKVLIDDTLKATSNKYGAQTMQKVHPCLSNDKWETQSKAAFQHPKALPTPTYRETDRFLQTANPRTRQSGFSQNHTQFDGSGWKPHPLLNSDLTRTEYRIQFNQEKPFQREPTQYKVRKIRTKEQNYKHT